VESRFEHPEGPGMTEDGVEQMLALAERLRASNGGMLDDSAVQAVAEATGAPVEYVRLAVKLRSEKETQSFLTKLRSQYLTLEPHTRRFVVSGASATMCALFDVAAARAQFSIQNDQNASSPGALFSIVSLVWLTLGLYNVCVTRDSKTGAATGAVFGASFFIARAMFQFALQMPASYSYNPSLIVLFTVFGALAGLGLQRMTDRYRKPLGLRDPLKERQDLLRQLVDLQDKLKSGEQSCTFLSVDIVGSTKMKANADPLAVEFTFNEYHNFVERTVKRYGGRVHSTAGDGVTAAFDHPSHAFGAARNIQAGLMELNAFRNKIGQPIELRQGIHTGTVVAPDATDVTSLNFSHVIDVAAHFQKAAPVGGIAVSDPAGSFLPGGLASIGNERLLVSGVEGTVWIPKVVSLNPSVTPPPLPGQV
jgi:class 3 adenylate cyclase